MSLTSGNKKTVELTCQEYMDVINAIDHTAGIYRSFIDGNINDDHWRTRLESVIATRKSIEAQYYTA